MTVSRLETIGVILAAGMGERLRPLTNDRPKALVLVAGAPLLAYDFAFLRAAGISRFVCVGGYGYAELAAAARCLEPETILLENRDYRQQNAVSFGLALERSPAGGLLVCDVDYIRSQAMAKIIAVPREEITLYVTAAAPPAQDVMCVRVGAENEVLTLAKGQSDCELSSAGIVYVPAERRAALAAATAEAIARRGAENARLEDALLAAGRSGVLILAHDVGPCDWVEVDTPEDLVAAEQFVQTNRAALALPAELS